MRQARPDAQCHRAIEAAGLCDADFMRRTPVIALVLEGEDCIAKVRELIGPTNSQAADPGTIRGDFGENMMVNVCHASDSADSAATEIQRFFKDGEVFRF